MHSSQSAPEHSPHTSLRVRELMNQPIIQGDDYGELNEPGWAVSARTLHPLLFGIRALWSFMTSVSQDLGVTSPLKDSTFHSTVSLTVTALGHQEGIYVLPEGRVAPTGHHLTPLPAATQCCPLVSHPTINQAHTCLASEIQLWQGLHWSGWWLNNIVSSLWMLCVLDLFMIAEIGAFENLPSSLTSEELAERWSSASLRFNHLFNYTSQLQPFSDPMIPKQLKPINVAANNVSFFENLTTDLKYLPLML